MILQLTYKLSVNHEIYSLVENSMIAKQFIFYKISFFNIIMKLNIIYQLLPVDVNSFRFFPLSLKNELFKCNQWLSKFHDHRSWCKVNDPFNYNANIYIYICIAMAPKRMIRLQVINCISFLVNLEVYCSFELFLIFQNVINHIT